MTSSLGFPIDYNSTINETPAVSAVPSLSDLIHRYVTESKPFRAVFLKHFSEIFSNIEMGPDPSPEMRAVRRYAMEVLQCEGQVQKALANENFSITQEWRAMQAIALYHAGERGDLEMLGNIHQYAPYLMGDWIDRTIATGRINHLELGFILKLCKLIMNKYEDLRASVGPLALHAIQRSLEEGSEETLIALYRMVMACCPEYLFELCEYNNVRLTPSDMAHAMDVAPTWIPIWMPYLIIPQTEELVTFLKSAPDNFHNHIINDLSKYVPILARIDSEICEDFLLSYFFVARALHREDLIPTLEEIENRVAATRHEALNEAV